MAQIYQDILGPLLAQIKGADNPVSAFMGGRRQSMLDNLAIADEARKKQQDDILNQYRLAQMAMIGQLTPYQQASLAIQRQQLARQLQNDQFLNSLRQAETQGQGAGGRYTPQLVKLQAARDKAIESGDTQRANEIQGQIAKMSTDKAMQTAAAQLADLKANYDRVVTPEAIEDYKKYANRFGDQEIGVKSIKDYFLNKLQLEPEEAKRISDNVNNVRAMLAQVAKITASSLREPQTNEGLRQAKAMLPDLTKGLATPENSEFFLKKGIPNLIQQYAKANMAGTLDAQKTLETLQAGGNPLTAPSGLANDVSGLQGPPLTDRQMEKVKKVSAQIGPTLQTLPGLSGGVSSQVVSDSDNDLTPEEVERLKALGYSR